MTHFFRTHTYSNLSIRPYLLDGAICYYDYLYEGYGPFMTVRTTLNKYKAHYQSGPWLSKSRRRLRGLNRRFAAPFLKLCSANVVSAAALGYAYVASVLALS